ncbi:flagellar protein FlgN [Chthonobacter rhizosphaerae]|uniref:flagellar protein FlgN n=1 Tax=Chthonobacter rhizosphaerae TaxID=2735553 RepID=UPI0015EFA9E6|nr:flagellar protein FlgN [Chthonobacter rhizosphaerae]
MTPAGLSAEAAVAADPLAAALARAEDVVGREIAALRSGDPLDLSETTFRKSQIYLDLVRLGREAALARPTPDLARRLDALRTLIAEDVALLALHMDAVRRISDIITDAVRQDTSDGTYSVTGAPAGRA